MNPRKLARAGITMLACLALLGVSNAVAFPTPPVVEVKSIADNVTGLAPPIVVQPSVSADVPVTAAERLEVLTAQRTLITITNTRMTPGAITGRRLRNAVTYEYGTAFAIDERSTRLLSLDPHSIHLASADTRAHTGLYVRRE